MKYLVCLFFIAFVAIPAIQCNPKPPFNSLEEARNAIIKTIDELNTIVRNFPRQKNPEDYNKLHNSILILIAHKDKILNELNFEYINHSHHYGVASIQIEKYKEYLHD